MNNDEYQQLQQAGRIVAVDMAKGCIGRIVSNLGTSLDVLEALKCLCELGNQLDNLASLVNQEMSDAQHADLIISRNFNELKRQLEALDLDICLEDNYYNRQSKNKAKKYIKASIDILNNFDSAYKKLKEG